jgi:hypothetical protein
MLELHYRILCEWRLYNFILGAFNWPKNANTKRK